MGTDRTRALFAPLIQRPTLTDQLLQRPPFKFLHDIVRETIQATGFPNGLFTEDELDSTKAGASRDNKIGFLQKLVDVLNVDGHLDDVKPAKIVAGKEAELTNLMLQSLASEATSYVQEEKERKKVAKKSASSSSKSKSSSSKNSHGKDGGEEKERSHREKSSSSKIPSSTTTSKHRSKENGHATTKEKDEAGKKSSSSKGSSKEKSSSSKEKERKKKHSESSYKSKSGALAEVDGQQPSTAALIIPSANHQVDETTTNANAIYNNSNMMPTSLPDTRRTPPDRESSGGTSKGGDDSGIAEETGAESERHDLSDRYSLNTHDAQRHETSKTSSPDFIEVHAPSPIPIHPSALIRPGTAIGRPQTAIGRPGTALARPAPPKPKKNVITSNLNAENDEPKMDANNNKQFQLILEDKKDVDAKDVLEQTNNFLVEEDEEQQFLMGANIGAGEGANIAKLQEGDEHGALVNKIIENTRELEREHLHEDDTFVEGDTFDIHEQRRIRVEIELAQKALQQTTQLVQPLVRTLEFVVDDFDAMLRDLEECRKQTAQLEWQLAERQAQSSKQTAKLDSTLRTLETDIRYTQEQIATTTSAILRNEQKIAELLAIN